MKNYFFILLFFYSCLLYTQHITVDDSTYSPQELIENILIDSDCISNVVVTNVVGGNFGGTDRSYGYFDATGTTFPIQSGLVLSTGRLSNVPGPNTSLSDDTATGWIGDNDLETVLNETNTLNATIIEFEFQSISETISFRYIFASEEYQEGNSNTCQYSDLFGFLIRPVTSSNYDNIAIVPGTSTPVKVTTVHSGIPGGCDPINEAYFGGWNNSSAPINFNGQTTVLTATAQVVPNETYHVKLVIADEQNYRYDSAVFLEAGSFQPDVNLGIDRLISTNNPICENETLQLNATQTGANSYTWYKDNVVLSGETNPTYTVTDAGVYQVDVEYSINCTATGNITIEYTANPIINDTSLIDCDLDQDGITVYNLFDAEQDVINNSSDFITGFYTSQVNAEQNTNVITDPTNYENSNPLQTVFARVENNFGCHAIAEVLLDISMNIVSIPPYEVCDDFPVDGYSVFDLNTLRTEIEALVPNGSTIQFFPSENAMLSNSDEIDGNYTNIIENEDIIYVLISNGSSCYAMSSVILKMKYTPETSEDRTLSYCTSSYPSSINLTADILNGTPQDFSYQWFFNGNLLPDTMSTISINEIGLYDVIVTHPNMCFATQSFSVVASETASIDTISVSGIAPNNELTIMASGSGDYEYALEANSLSYQDDNTFTNIPAGVYTVYVRDKNGCGVTEERVYVLGFPSFFTPNGDYKHDTWKPIGIDSRIANSITVKIYDRYGKLLKQINPLNEGWDGTFNNEKMPVDDYWYVTHFTNGKSYRGHFTLKR